MVRSPVAGRVDYFTEMCSGSGAGSYLRPIDFVYHSYLGLRVMTTKKKEGGICLRGLKYCVIEYEVYRKCDIEFVDLHLRGF